MEQLLDSKNPKAITIIDQLCEKLHCSELAEDLERVNHAREMLAKLQQREVYEHILEKKENKNKAKPTSKDGYGRKISHIISVTKQHLSHPTVLTQSDDESIDSADNDNGQEGDEEYEIVESVHCDELSEDAWLGFFKGYQILKENQELSLSENKQCIEISHKDCSSNLDGYLRSGVRCFMIDLFRGTELENQKLIFCLRENELKIAHEIGFPITTTLFAMLSPRQQYTGMLEPTVAADYQLEKEDEITLTTNRLFSSCGNRKKIYVNARFLIEDCKIGDFILMGPTIQLVIVEILPDELRCLVMERGILGSRLPVLFPGRCKRSQISVEELEDITFAREVGINVLVTYIAGTPQYLDDLYDALRLLNCENLRICARIVLNQIKGETHDQDWICDRYDGFLLELSTSQHLDACLASEGVEKQPNNLELSPAAVYFIAKAYQLKKPIILNPSAINERQLFVQTYNFPEIFYYPDKYVFACEKTGNSFFFYLLQNAIYSKIPEIELSLTPYCDQSQAGEDTLARSAVAASFESEAKAILVCSSIADMAIKLSHFRPKAPIFYLTSTKSSGDYISMFHNIIFMYFRNRAIYTHADFITNAFIYGLIYLKSRKILKSNQNVILVYGNEQGTKMPDKYLVYKFDVGNFADNLLDVLFT